MSSIASLSFENAPPNPRKFDPEKGKKLLAERKKTLEDLRKYKLADTDLTIGEATSQIQKMVASLVGVVPAQIRQLRTSGPALNPNIKFGLDFDIDIEASLTSAGNQTSVALYEGGRKALSNIAAGENINATLKNTGEELKNTVKDIGCAAIKGVTSAVGGALGGAVGTYVAPGIGTYVGGALGGMVGGLLGDLLCTAFGAVLDLVAQVFGAIVDFFASLFGLGGPDNITEFDDFGETIRFVGWTSGYQFERNQMTGEIYLRLLRELNPDGKDRTLDEVAKLRKKFGYVVWWNEGGYYQKLWSLAPESVDLWHPERLTGGIDVNDPADQAWMKETSEKALAAVREDRPMVMPVWSSKLWKQANEEFEKKFLVRQSGSKLDLAHHQWLIRRCRELGGSAEGAWTTLHDIAGGEQFGLEPPPAKSQDLYKFALTQIEGSSPAERAIAKPQLVEALVSGGYNRYDASKIVYGDNPDSGDILDQREVYLNQVRGLNKLLKLYLPGEREKRERRENTANFIGSPASRALVAILVDKKLVLMKPAANDGAQAGVVEGRTLKPSMIKKVLANKKFAKKVVDATNKRGGLHPLAALAGIGLIAAKFSPVAAAALGAGYFIMRSRRTKS